jgi:hypothetical protein
MGRNSFKSFYIRKKDFLLRLSIRHFDISTMFYLLITINSTHVDSIYPNDLEIKNTTECSASAWYLNILLKLDTNSKLTTQLNDKQDDFNFSIVNFPYLCSNIPISPAYGVFTVSFTDSFPQMLRSLQRSSLTIQPSYRPSVVWCVSYYR